MLKHNMNVAKIIDCCDSIVANSEVYGILIIIDEEAPEITLAALNTKKIHDDIVERMKHPDKEITAKLREFVKSGQEEGSNACANMAA